MPKQPSRKVPTTDNQLMQIVCKGCKTPKACKAQDRCRLTGRRLEKL
jgi:hypothetical protein